VFYERENEYTLAGSIYKGRVTRVLPGMQSAFVDIGLERDAFLYVSDFLELGDEEDAEEFGEIPAPPAAVNLSRQSQAEESSIAAETSGKEHADFVESAEAASSEDSEAESEGRESTAASEESRQGEGARRWRGRRRRGGRRGGREDRYSRTEQPRTEAQAPAQEAETPEPAAESRPTPQRYAPIVLPGESISKYRNMTPPAAEADAMEQESAEAVSSAPVAAMPVEDFRPPVEAEPEQEFEYEEVEESVEAPVQESTQSAFGHVEDVVHHAPAEPLGKVEADVRPDRFASFARDEAAAVIFNAPPPRFENVETAEDGTIEVAGEATGQEDTHAEDTDAAQVATGFQRHAAPEQAPEGRTLEHETLDDDEMEFHPMPENIEALREVAGDAELELEEETLDGDSYSDRWIPKVADVDEDEVVAAEERGETRFVPSEEEDEEDDEETNGRAELRAPAPTAGYQQRQAERPGYDRRGQRGRRGRRNNVRPYQNRPQPLISDLLKEGQEILIQIAKEPIAKKGARITSHIALPGRFLVYMPTVNHVGVSRKINSEEERQRLKRIVTSERENGLGGFIVRTAAANIKEDELRADIRFLKHLWAEIKNRAENSKPPALIYHDLNLVERVLRDQVNADFSQVWVDTEDGYERVVRFAQRFQPSLVRRIKLYTKTTPLFEHFGIQDEINNALKSKVWLKTGGYIVINQTEALVAIDINTGKYVGKTQRLEDTIVKTNIDAVKEIVRQIRLRDLGGIIVIDFIDMDERRNRQKVMAALEEALRADRAPSKALQFNDFGLVAITRKRVKQSLERTLGDSCPYCAGAGFVKSVTTVCNEIYIEMRKMIKEHERTDISLRVNPEVAKALKAGNGKLLTEMEELTGKNVLVKSDPMLHQENFDIQ
jgi:ribonuclease G